MTIHEAIQSRHSVRKYIDKPIEENLVRILQDKVNEVNAEEILKEKFGVGNQIMLHIEPMK